MHIQEVVKTPTHLYRYPNFGQQHPSFALPYPFYGSSSQNFVEVVVLAEVEGVKTLIALVSFLYSICASWNDRPR